MIKREEFERSRKALQTIFELYNLYVIKKHEAKIAGIKVKAPSCFYVHRGLLQHIDHPHDDNTRIRANSISGVSFIMGENHRLKSVALKFGYDTGNLLRIGHEIYEPKDMTEEWLFQYSLVQSPEEAIDLEFYLYLKEKDFQHNFTLRDNAHSLEGLLDIQCYVQNSVQQYIGTVDERLAQALCGKDIIN